MRALPLVLALCVLAGCDRTVRVNPPVDAGPVCEGNERLVKGTCRFVCERDGDCATGERCNLLIGQCEPKPPPPDAGDDRIPCTEGAVRCSADNTAVQTCGASGVFTTSEQCVQPEGFCQNERCLVCRPGAARCVSGGGSAEICLDDGSGYRQVTCATGATCVSGECVECTVGQRRCSADNRTLEECHRLPREDLSAGFVPAGDNFDGVCVTQVCEQGPQGPQCRAPACLPGALRCANTSTQQACSPTGTWTDVPCSSLPNMGPTAECINGACVDECGEAVRARSYFGCDYWSTITDNSMDSLFKGGALSGQGTADSDFAFVVTNQSVTPATVEVWRFVGSAPVRVKTVTVPGRNDPATKGLLKIPVPWQSITPASVFTGNAYSGRARYAYRLTSTRPVTVYQFNPMDAVKVTNRTCSATAGATDCGCNEYGDFTSSGCGFLGLSCCSPGVCAQVSAGKRCSYATFSNDASLVLPAHILGSSYVGLTMEHLVYRPNSNGTGAPQSFTGGSLSVVAPGDNTVVTIRAAARTRASVVGTSVAAMAAGETRTFTLQSYEVLQLSSDLPAGLGTPATGNLQCGLNPYDAAGTTSVCRVSGADLTGSVITSDKPIAVFGSSDCTLRGFLDTACDHVEEQLFPFVTWGKSFVAARTAPLRLTNNQFASAANAGPDYYKIVAGCPDSACPNGTLLTLSAAPAAGDVLSSAGGCEPGTSLPANNCRLRGGRFIEFRSKTSFTITADQPIQAAQVFAGQDATTGTTRPAQGDPSLVLLPPVEQWRARYTVLSSPGTRDNYLGVVIDGARVSQVLVDGVVVATGFSNIANSTFRVANIPVSVGSHTIEVRPLPNQTQLPGAGVTVYGFDSYVSYGYTGGLDLTTIVTGVNPGG
ncbi:MAG: IgGFc-binding protein [Archangium sp.]|nr:IgGFc-binding protein [Archangium sp.]